MKKLFPIFLLAILLLAGCSTQRQIIGGHDENEQKKLLCANKLMKVQNFLGSEMTVETPFFTQQLNTCAYVASSQNMKYLVNMYNQEKYEDLTGFYVLYNAPLICETTNQNCIDESNNFDLKVIELKGSLYFPTE